MARVKAWKVKDASCPSFPSDYEIKQRAVLQKTDLEKNNNKYYGIELHEASNQYRVFTHYGRTGDLANNPEAGVKETRFFTSMRDAQAEYNRIYKSKTGSRKGYVEANLASSNIGSEKARGMSSGHVDEETLSKIAPTKKKKTTKKKVSVCPPDVRDLISLIYGEATKALTTTVQAKITAKGIETPIGVLTIAQIEKGETLLKEIFECIGSSGTDQELKGLSGAFYTTVPHRLGRSRANLQAAIINDKSKVAEKEETLQLMRDMLSVDGEEHNVLASDHLGPKFKALGAETLSKLQGVELKEMQAFLARVGGNRYKVRNIYKVVRPGEDKTFNPNNLGDVLPLFHGSRIQNWVGLLTRGVLMPKLVVQMGGSRTDGGWLGAGIYYGDTMSTSAYYTSAGNGGGRIMALHDVAMGKRKVYKTRNFNLSQPPTGYDSCFGDPTGSSQFADREFVIYNTNQQRMRYLVEFGNKYGNY